MNAYLWPLVYSFLSLQGNPLAGKRSASLSFKGSSCNLLIRIKSRLEIVCVFLLQRRVLNRIAFLEVKRRKTQNSNQLYFIKEVPLCHFLPALEWWVKIDTKTFVKGVLLFLVKVSLILQIFNKIFFHWDYGTVSAMACILTPVERHNNDFIR